MAAVSLVIAIVALIIAVASAAYARRQAIANERAAAIEGQRRHDELTPQVTVTCKGHAGGRNADMILELTGPAGLDGLDEMTIRIRDDTTDHRPSPGSQFGQEQISDVIWGPYRFNPGLHQASSDRRVMDRSTCQQASLTQSRWNRASHRHGSAGADGPGTGTSRSAWRLLATVADTLPGFCTTRSTLNPIPRVRAVDKRRGREDLVGPGCAARDDEYRAGLWILLC
jgi:hypothetical protein